MFNMTAVRTSTRRHRAFVLGALVLMVVVAGCSRVGDESVLYRGNMQEAPMADAAYDMDERAYESEASGGEYASNTTSVALDERQLVFTGRMGLRVEDTIAAMDEATTWAADNEGFIEQSSTNDWEGAVSGDLTMRVPSESFEDARAHLRTLAVDVLSDEKEREDVTGQYADYRARLDNLKAAESELREIMAQIREEGGTAEEVLSVHRELTSIRGQIESLQAQLDALSEQIAYSTIHVTFSPLPTEPEIVADQWRPRYVLRRAMGDLVGGLQNLADAAIYFTVALLPLLLVMAVGAWLLYKIFRRFRPKKDKRTNVTTTQDTPPSNTGSDG